MSTTIDSTNAMIFKQGGFYYNVSGNDALILHKYLGYKLYGKNKPRTGFPVGSEQTVLAKIDALHINYYLLNQKGEVIAQRKFEDNRYQVVDMPNWRDHVKKKEPPANSSANPPNEEAAKNRPAICEENALGVYLNLLDGLSRDVNIFTGEIIEGLDDTLRGHLRGLADYLLSSHEHDSSSATRGKRTRFNPTRERLAAFRYSDEPISITELHARLDELVDLSKMRRIARTRIRAWLMTKGLVVHGYDEHGNSILIPTASGRASGITTATAVKDGVPYQYLLFDIKAQHLIIEKIDEIKRTKSRWAL